MTTDIPDWIAFFAIVGMEEFRLILKGDRVKRRLSEGPAPATYSAVPKIR